MTERRYDTYGVSGVSLAEARTSVEQALQIEFEERDSSYYGGSYFSYRLTTGRQIMIYRNYDDEESTWVHEEFRPFLIVISVSDLEDMNEIQVRLQGALDVVLLKQKIFPRDDDDDDDDDDSEMDD